MGVCRRHPFHRRGPELELLNHGQGEKITQRHRKFNLVERVCQVEMQTMERLPRLDLLFVKDAAVASATGSGARP